MTSDTALASMPASDAPAFRLTDLCLLPIVIFFMILAQVAERFEKRVASLKARRRARAFREDWQSFLPRLRECDWYIAQILAGGARRLLAGEDLDPRTIRFSHGAPDDFRPDMPRTVFLMHQRWEAVARFHADPIARIERLAARIAARAAAICEFTGEIEAKRASSPACGGSGSRPQVARRWGRVTSEIPPAHIRAPP